MWFDWRSSGCQLLRKWTDLRSSLHSLHPIVRATLWTMAENLTPVTNIIRFLCAKGAQFFNPTNSREQDEKKSDWRLFNSTTNHVKRVEQVLHWRSDTIYSQSWPSETQNPVQWLIGKKRSDARRLSKHLVGNAEVRVTHAQFVLTQKSRRTASSISDAPVLPILHVGRWSRWVEFVLACLKDSFLHS